MQAFVYGAYKCVNACVQAYVNVYVCEHLEMCVWECVCRNVCVIWVCECARVSVWMCEYVLAEWAEVLHSLRFLSNSQIVGTTEWL